MNIIEERIRIVDEASATLRKVGREANRTATTMDGLRARMGKLKAGTTALRDDIGKMTAAQEASTAAAGGLAVGAAAAGFAVYYAGRQAIRAAQDLEKLQRGLIESGRASRELGPGLNSLANHMDKVDVATTILNKRLAENTSTFTKWKLAFTVGIQALGGGLAAGNFGIGSLIQYLKDVKAEMDSVATATSGLDWETKKFADDIKAATKESVDHAKALEAWAAAAVAAAKRLADAMALANNRSAAGPGAINAAGGLSPNLRAERQRTAGLPYYAPGSAGYLNQGAAAGGPPIDHLAINMADAARASEEAAARSKAAWLDAFGVIGQAADVFGETFIKNTKARALLSIAVDTAAGIMKAIATGGDNIAAGLAMGVAVAGIGAMQAAAVLKATKGGAPQGLSYGGGGGLNALTGRGGGGGAGALVVSGAGGGGGFNLWDAISGLFSEEEQTYDYGGGANSGRGGSYRRGGGTIHIRAADRDGALRELVRDLNRILGPRGLGLQLSGV